MSTAHKTWLEDIEFITGQAELRHVDLIVDQAGWNQPIITALNLIKPSIQWFSLFTGTPEESLLHDAPVLMRIDLDEPSHQNWMGELIREAAPRFRLMMLFSPLSFELLCPVLRGFGQLAWDSYTGVLRFYDPRIFPTLIGEVLSESQREHFLRIALFWSWLGRDQSPVWERGRYESGLVVSINEEVTELDTVQIGILRNIQVADTLRED